MLACVWSISLRAFGKMSRQSMQPPRPLSLTEELEKLEQSITLTLQGETVVNQPVDKVLILLSAGRNRPKLQPSSPDRYYQYSALCRTVHGAFPRRLGGCQGEFDLEGLMPNRLSCLC